MLLTFGVGITLFLTWALLMVAVIFLKMLSSPFISSRRPPPAPKDPCNPSPCGPNTSCTKSPNGNAICRCIANFIPKPDTITGCGPECVRDPDCDRGFVCENQRCVEKPDPCNPSPCGPRTTCMVNNLGNPICR